MKFQALRRNQSAFTIAEMLVAAGCGSLLVAALLAGSVSIQRNSAAVEAYAVAEGDELRIQDYIAMDCRRAVDTTVDKGAWASVSGTWTWVPDASGTQTLIITVPAYYTSTGTPVAPFFDSNGRLQYGVGGVAATQQISYYKSGSNFMRQVGTNPTASKPSGAYAIATDVASFTVMPQDQSATSGTLSYSVTFSPRFQSIAPGVDGTTIFAKTFLRNARARQ